MEHMCLGVKHGHSAGLMCSVPSGCGLAFESSQQMLGQYYGQRIPEACLLKLMNSLKEKENRYRATDCYHRDTPQKSHQTPLFRGLWDEQIQSRVIAGSNLWRILCSFRKCGSGEPLASPCHSASKLNLALCARDTTAAPRLDHTSIKTRYAGTSDSLRSNGLLVAGVQDVVLLVGQETVITALLVSAENLEVVKVIDKVIVNSNGEWRSD